ncbi:S-layer homology domain-containing protein [Lysinibacillus sp. 54212]|uniref:S-layer homology domain-containing protein n=1 Tax=Lysinibacillus sp. 54212 TaxID=3119829 RepID=UPI002FCADB92
MDKKKVQKLNRAAVATVLAASGVSVVAPVIPEASVKFKDLDSNAYYYQPVLELTERGIVAGFGDGTFRPNSPVTRGQAAKMIAKSVGLNTSNIKNPEFRDVSTKDPFYPYIAALANQGAISGYTDKTFRPNEPITRGQMAKILSVGFGFEKATALNHDFTDVKSNHPFAYYIQTIYNLKITQGVNAISFAPQQIVSRGQLASFIIRAENATSDYKPVKEIGNITDTTVYINGVAHFIDPSLRNIINTTNKEVLKGAHIEGTITGTTLKSITKLTLNAAGTASKHLILDGKDSTFSGELIIRGNYVRFKNWNLTGAVTIAETPPRTIGSLDRLQNMRIASISGLGFIDWEKPTNPDNGGDNSSGDGDLVDKPSGGNNGDKVVERMPVIEKYIDFSNCTVKRLIIEQNRTYVAASNTLPHVTVQGDVKQYEIYGDITTLYVETDVNTTMYGVSDIKTIYKNSFKNVYFNTDSFVEKLIVDNSYGWIDLGENFYADKVIIPPNKGPNDIFNDFINDNDNIGDLEDTGGNEVDKDPDDTVVPDYEAPTLFIDDDIKTQGSTATVTMESNEDGIIYYMVREEDERPPSIREILEGSNENWAGNTTVSEGIPKAITISDLDDKKKYVIYAVVVDDAGNVSDKESEKFEIVDSTPPTIKPVSAVGLPGGKRIEVTINPDEKGTYYYYYRPTVDATEDPTAQGIIDRFEANNSRTGSGKVDGAGQLDFRIPNLDAQTSYDIYVVMKDEYGNLTPVPEKVTVSTTELDNVHPYVTNGFLEWANRENYEFEIEINEHLDEASAIDINNYELSGTGIVNVTGQQTIKPDSIKYTALPNGKSKLTIRIPSVTGFVNDDTLVVTILPGVKDLADNEFVNKNVVPSMEEVKNKATYVHSDTLPPALSKLKFTKNPDGTSGLLEFDANKAGTYYYMILPDDFDMTNIKNRDFYNDFTDAPTPGISFSQAISKYGKDGNNAVEVGANTPKNVILPIEKTDPFKSYSLHILMKDRSGNLSRIESVPVISDARAPFIRSYAVKPVEGSNTSVKIEIDSSEKGIVYYRRLPKLVDDGTGTGTMIDNPQIAELENLYASSSTALANAAGNIKASNDPIVQQLVTQITGWTNSTLIKDQNTITNYGLNPHEEYVYYFAVEDTFGNMTVFPEGATAGSYNTANKMLAEVYTDGVQPEIGSIIKRMLQSEFETSNVPVTWGASLTSGDGIIEYKPNRTFSLTFSEAIALSAAGDKVPVDENTVAVATLETLRTYIEKTIGSGTIADIEWQNLDGVGTWQQRNLIITFKDSVDITDNITIDMRDTELENVLDLARHSFSDSHSVAKYEYPTNLSNRINGVQLSREGGSSGIVDGKQYSNTVEAIMELGVTLEGWQQSYYYVSTLSDKTSLTDAEVSNIVKSLNTNSRINMSNIVVYGRGDITGSGSLRYLLKTSSMPGATINDVFQYQQNLFVFTIDKYGNIVWAVDDADGTTKYRKISGLPTLP